MIAIEYSSSMVVCVRYIVAPSRTPPAITPRSARPVSLRAILHTRPTVTAPGRQDSRIVIFTTRSPGNTLRKRPRRMYSGLPIGCGTIHQVELASQSPESPETNIHVYVFADISE